jgi:DNA topoisomerase-3
MFEADLAEIGRASTRAEAIRRAAAYQERTRSRVGELITMIGQSSAVAFDPAYLPTTPATDGKPPTKAMIAFATSIAAQRGLKMPRGLKSHSAICRAFLDQHAPARSSERGKPAPTGPRPPSEAMVRYARSLAEQEGIECPPAAIADFVACRAFLDEHSRKAQNAQSKDLTVAPKSRRTTVSGGSGDTRRERVPIRDATAAGAKAPRRHIRPRAALVGTDD